MVSISRFGDDNSVKYYWLLKIIFFELIDKCQVKTAQFIYFKNWKLRQLKQNKESK